MSALKSANETNAKRINTPVVWKRTCPFFASCALSNP